MERLKPQTPEKQKKPYFVVFCEDEGRTLYESFGENIQIERIVAENTAYGHANDLGHKVLIFENKNLVQ